MDAKKIENEPELRIEKKPFDKKKWREHRYSNKAKIQKWDNVKRRQAFRQYHKQLKKFEALKPDGSNNPPDEQRTGFNALKQAQMNYRRIQQEKEEKKKEIEIMKKQRSEAIKAYKKKKAIKFQKLNKKTKKGQPIMKGRIELLLEKIEKDYANRNT